MTGKTTSRRENSPERTKANILDVAIQEFADKGLAGARVDEIASKTHTSKRMIYYYFGGKEGLYLAVLEAAYAPIRERETGGDFDALPADEALAAHVSYTFDYHARHPAFVRLVMNENFHQGTHIRKLAGSGERSERVLATLGAILDKGAKQGLFRPNVDPVDLHLSISALCFYNVSNVHTVGATFGIDMSAPDVAAWRRTSVVQMILAFVRA